MDIPALSFTPRGTTGHWYTHDEDPGPSASTYGPDLWDTRRKAWLAGTLELNPALPKIPPQDASSTHSDDPARSSIDGSPPTSTTTLTTQEEPTTTTKPVLSAIQSLSARARGKLPSFLHTYAPTPPTSGGPKSPSPPLTSLERLEALLAEPGAEESEKLWRQGGLEAVWRMLTGSKTLKQPMRLGLVIRILKAGWIRDGTWPSSLAKDGKSRRAMEATMDDPFFDSPPGSPVVVREHEQRDTEREEYRPPRKL
ncbi:hypothetical protein NCC49_001181 [Naganishia albida]|nr:hypothetical protein NCC49_001181 [Naganishia albida]